MNKEIYDITDLYEAVKINDELKEENHNLCKELDKYKNIVDELEKWLNKNLPIREQQDLQIVIDKLKELKGE